MERKCRFINGSVRERNIIVSKTQRLSWKKLSFLSISMYGMNSNESTSADFREYNNKVSVMMLSGFGLVVDGCED
jgi:hypothetical protein